jgi:hypothetical protein
MRAANTRTNQGHVPVDLICLKGRAMAIRRRLAPVAALFLHLAGATANAGPVEEADAVLSRLEQAFNSANWDEVVALYTKDVHFFGTLQAEMVVGSKALRKYYETVPKGAKIKAPSNAVIQLEPNVLISSGYFLVNPGSGNEVVRRSTFVMHKVDGKWLIAQAHVSTMPKR